APRHQSLELRPVPFLLLGHFGDLGRMRAAVADHVELPLIDARGAELARLVDADHPRDVLLFHGARRSFPSNQRIARPPAAEKRKFHPASEMPASAQGA